MDAETRFVQVAVNIPGISAVFDYHVPPELAGQVLPGCLVVAPFGTQMVQGVVLRSLEEPSVPQTRPILDLVDPLPVLNARQLALAHWMAAETLSPLAACLDVMIPPGLSQHADLQAQKVAEPASPPGPLEGRLLDLLTERGTLRGRQLEAAFPHQNWRAALRALQKSGCVLVRSTLPPPRVQPKMIRTVQAAGALSEADLALERLSAHKEVAARRRRILDVLLKEPLPIAPAWLYARSGGSLADLNRLAEMGLVTFNETEIWRDPLREIPAAPSDPLPLTPDQAAAFEVIAAEIRAAAAGKPGRPCLLQGVTGSGKTELYLQAAALALELGRQAVILVPEIALTPQTVRRFLSRFGSRVGLVHSRLSPGERYDTWRRIRAGLLPVVVGARSALFAPLANPGLIIIDECHEESYYQDDMPPVYHAVETALAYARQNGAAVVLGSATPELTQAYRARQGVFHDLRLPLRIQSHTQGGGSGLPPVQVVDMRAELKAGNRSFFSESLQKALGRVLEANEQAILFLNRRGTATYVFCRDCGQALRCPRCEKPLTFHNPQSALICHTCNYRRQMPKTCPNCRSTQIRQFGTGTEKVEAEVQGLFPQARTLRWDAETTRQKGAHEVILSHFAAHRADILIGTQMLAKGLDLPLVTLVGVVLAEVSLNLPDYRAPERTFQVLAQVAGRAGRADRGGQVILQTFQPQHYAIQAAAGHNFEAFYVRELAYRQEMNYPPFCRLLRLEFQHADWDTAQRAAEHMADSLQQRIEAGERRATELIGPAPCFFSRVNGQYRWQVVVRSPNPVTLLRGVDLQGWRIGIDPLSLL